MSEDKKTRLKETLSSLTNEEKAWVINYLVQGLFTLPPAVEDEKLSQRRAVRVKHRNGSPTDEQLETLFKGKDSSSAPTEDYTWSDVVIANSGKTIKPIEKWL